MKKSVKAVFMFGILLICLLSITSIRTGDLNASTDWGNKSDNLYKVIINSQKDAQTLSGLGFDALLRIQDGYLILVKPTGEKLLAKSGLDFELIAGGLDRYHLALDIRFDDYNLKKYPVIYQESGVRLLKVEPSDLDQGNQYNGLAPIKTENIRIIYKEKLSFAGASPANRAFLDSIVALIEQDSLESYVEALQAFPPRVTGSAANYASRDWLIGKFEEFGYDSVVQDSFVYSSYQCQNVVAYKVGTTYPDHQIIVGAHRDAVSGSPGADDNGSGAAAVLDIARVLKDIDTKMTFIFLLFDSEEQGLNGAWHYADNAAANGDSIVLMLNMDMIAYISNTNSIKIYYGEDDTWAQLCQNLIDTLPGVTLNGVMSGSLPNSDHYAFQQNGYDVILLHEYVFSTVYHSYQDSTSYMNFEYMTKAVKGAMATCYVVNNTYVPLPGLLFSYPGGVPEVLTPGVEETFQVQIDPASGGVLVPATGKLHYKIAGQFPNQVSMAYLGDGLYDATLPALVCSQNSVEFWVLADERTGGTMYDPDTTNPFVAFPASNVTTIFEDDFDSDLGWTISGGQWARGTPTGGGGQYGGPDPVGGFSGSNVYGYNLSGDYGSGIPEYHLTTPALDCSGLYNTKLKFWRWLGVEQPLYDHAYIRISNNGTSWTTIWENEEEVTDYSWIEQDFDISQYADDQPVVYVRWSMGETDGAWQYCGWNIDDVRIVAYECSESEITIITGDLPDWTINIPMSQQLIASGGSGPLTWSDKNNDLAGTGLTLSTDGILSGTPTASGPISFIAEVSDGTRATTEKTFDFMINQAVTIVTDVLPDADEGTAYSQILVCSGGTGAITWSDKNGDLAGSGLALATDGTLSGTPTVAETIQFTAQAEDIIGGGDEKLLSLVVNSTYTCGDVNSDGDINIFDITFVISFLYKDGEAPAVMESADVNNDTVVNIFDITYLITFLYGGGPEPDCP